MREISADDYVAQVNNAGEGVWVVLHLYKQGVPLCALINQYLVAMAARFPTVKFLRSISTTCIPNYPDQNLPTCFVYFEGQLKVCKGCHQSRFAVRNSNKKFLTSYSNISNILKNGINEPKTQISLLPRHTYTTLSHYFEPSQVILRLKYCILQTLY